MSRLKIIKPSELKLSAELLKSQAQSLYITSTESGSGTTTCAYALTLALRELVTAPVLLIDGNSNNPDLTRHFLLEGQPGFNEWVRADGGSLNHFVHTLAEDDIHIMGNGEPGSARGIAELIGSGLAALSESYPYVVFDGPDLNSSIGMSLATHFSGVVLVSAESESRLDLIQSAQQQIKQAGAHMAGAVLNRRRNRVPSWLSKLI